MNNKNKLQSVLNKRFDSVKNILKKSTRLLPAIGVAISGGVAVIEEAEAGAITQAAGNKPTYAATDTLTFTATTAITILTAADTMLSATNVNGTNLVWSYAGGNDLTITNAFTATAGETIQVNLAGTSTEMTLGEASVVADANASITFGLAAGTILEITNDDTHVFGVDGSAAFAGKLTVSGTTTFSRSAGSTNGIAEIAIADGKTGTFSETVKATTINSVGTLTALKGITGTSIVLTAAGNLTNTDDATYTSNFTEAAVGSISVLTIKNSTDNEAPSVATLSGDVTIDTVTIGSSTTGGSAKFTGDVVAATAINAISGNTTNEDSVIEFTGDVTATAIVLTNATSSADTTMKTSGTIAKTVTGTINGASTLSAGNAGGTTFASAIGATTQLTEIVVVAAKEATFNSTVDAATLDVNGTTTLKVGGNTIAEFELATTGVLYIDKAITDGSTLWTSATQSDTGIAAGKIYMPANLTNGQTLLIADSNLGNAVDTDMATAIQDTALTDYTTAGEADVLTITSVDKSITSIATTLDLTTDTAQAVLQARNAVGIGGNSGTRTDFLTNSANAVNGQTVADLTTFAKEAAPQADLAQGSMASTRAMTGSVQSVISNRMASLRSGDAFQTGIVAGDMVSANSAFMQAIGSIVEQKNTKDSGRTVAGYDSETVGVAVGFDMITNGGSVFGLSVSAAETEVTGLGAGKATNDIESYTASLYMDRTGENGFLEGSVTLGYNDHDSARKLKTGGVTSNYKSSYSSEQASLRIKGGAPKEVGSSSFVTPFASVTATVIDTDAHSESSDQASDDLRLKQEQDQINSVVGTVGFKVHSVTDFGVPMISFALNNEFGDTSISTTNTYLGGGSAFKTKTEVEEMSATVGLGYTFGSDGATLNIGYEAEANDDDYLSHFGTIKLVGKF